ncbi:hypothetical protein G6F36_015893 [Rhizopus arrhizus]|nr:hypothetical protein G6F36_015893 [Rhizopus arrhizus]
MSKLRTPEKDEHYTPAAWRVGFYIGLTLALFARVLQLALDPDVQDRLPNMLCSEYTRLDALSNQLQIYL